MTEDDPRCRHANGAGCLDKFTFAQRQHFSPHDPGIALPTSQTEHQDNVAEAWPQHSHQRKSQDELRKGEHNVHQRHDSSIHPPA